MVNCPIFDKPQGTVWPRRDAPRLGIGIGKSKFGYLAIGGNSFDFPTNRFGEPECAVWPSCDASGATILRRYREFGDRACCCNPRDIGTQLCEPQRDVRIDRYLSRYVCVFGLGVVDVYV